LGFVFKAAVIGWLPGSSAAAEQERVGALIGLVDERQSLVVEHPHCPSAALESAPAVLIRRAAVSLHHSIDGDLRHGGQSHGFALSLVCWSVSS
jgi:hypothetical protein